MIYRVPLIVSITPYPAFQGAVATGFDAENQLTHEDIVEKTRGKEVKSFDDLVICDRLRPIRDQKDKIVKKSQPFDWD